jgi:hypothetical protein
MQYTYGCEQNCIKIFGAPRKEWNRHYSISGNNQLSFFVYFIMQVTSKVNFIVSTPIQPSATHRRSTRSAASKKPAGLGNYLLT